MPKQQKNGHMSWMRDLIKPAWALPLAFTALLAACSTQAGSETPQAETVTQEAVHPVSGLEIIIVKVMTAGATHGFAVELADSPAEQARGLMFRTELGDDEGMLFPSVRPQMRSFWMKNTPLPLDIIFIGPDRRILNIAANTVPYSLESVVSAGPAIAVLELRGGRAEELGIEPGDMVEW
jgi:uncharacterized membrane protein (UPF0127 family)